MKRWITRFLLLQVLLSAAAAFRAFLPGCSSCETGNLPDLLLGACGAAFYFVLWGSTRRSGFTRPFALLFGGATALHAFLLFHMMETGLYCLWCALAAGNAFLLALLLLFSRTARLPLLGGMTTTALLLLASHSLFSPPTSRADSLRLVVYERPDCPYCHQLREQVLPPILRNFPNRLSVEYRDARGIGEIRKTPTLLLDDSHAPEIIEGMPSTAYLRERIVARLSGEERP